MVMNMKKVIYAFICVLLAGSFAITAVKAATQTKRNQKIEKVQIQLKELKIDQAEQNIELLKKQLQDAHGDKQKIEELNKKIEEQDKQLEAALQAKAKKVEEQRLAAEKAAQAQRTALRTATASAATGSCAEWMAAAGIPNSVAANKLIGGESGCRPGAVNPSSGACGIPQALPCSKMPCSLSDPVCQLKWMNSYVAGRYGSWDNAYATWLSRSPHWY